MRLIGIKTGEGDPRIMKNLQPNSWYPFGDYIEPIEENGWEWRTVEQIEKEEACGYMYKYMTENKELSIDITVNCIVGKNGSGKSSLLDLLYRIINNFSYRLFDQLWEDNDLDKNPQRGHSLEEAKNFDATLYFETDGFVGSIRYFYGNYEYNYHSNKEDASIRNNRLDKKLSKTFLEKLTRHFFYTICTNYSIHSLNANDYTPNKLWIDANQDTNGNWLKGLFHKNDGYVVPIVMVPYRDNEGIIDINNENELAKLRLATLAVLFASKGKKFLDGYTPKYLVYRFKNDSEKYYNTKFNELYKKWLPLNNQTTKLKSAIKRRWRHEINYAHNTFKTLPKVVKEAVLSYITYKTFKSCINYRQYGELLGIRKLTKEEESKIIKKDKKGFYLELKEQHIDEIINGMHYKDATDHVNYKIQQLLYFIDHQTYNVSNLDIPSDCTWDPSHLVEYGWSKMNIPLLFNKDNNGRKSNAFKTYDEVLLRMPPAIFEWDISFSKEGKEEETLSQMSSGERQFMHSLSYIIYHLNNIQSVKEGSYRVRYHNVTLIFDEAELYYHPEFQRKFISSLIKMLSWSNINTNIIRGVNIIIVTHSPFVLSDVPVAHTLYLKNGHVYKNDKQTFCGNIHELLGNNFFMDYSIGDVAKENIEEIIRLYHEGNSDNSRRQFQQNINKYEYITSIVADDYLRLKLNEMLSELYKHFRGEDMSLLDRQINEKRKQLEALENQRKNLIEQNKI